MSESLQMNESLSSLSRVLPSLCLVTAFLDIGRGEWQAFRRSIQQYIGNFLPYLCMKHELIVFMDEKYSVPLEELCRNRPNIKIYSINRTWMEKHIVAYRQLLRETEIMNSDEFKRKIAHRIHHPECSQPEYNIMQHAKIDFVCHVIEEKLSSAEYYAWTDFWFLSRS